MPAVRATEAPLPVAAAASAQRSMCDARGVGAASPAAREGEERAPGPAPRPGAASRERALGPRGGPAGVTASRRCCAARSRRRAVRAGCDLFLERRGRRASWQWVLDWYSLSRPSERTSGAGLLLREQGLPTRVSVFRAPGEAAPASPCPVLTVRPDGCVGL